MPKDPYQLRLSGSGGQGLILAGMIIAEAAVRDGKNVVQTQSYGPEARLGASRSEVIISSRRISFLEVLEPDLLLCLSQDSFNKYSSQVRRDTVVVIDSTNVKAADPPGVERFYRLPITEVAIKDVGNRITANVVALGALNEIEGLVSWGSLHQALVNRVPARFRELNERALQIGRSLPLAD
ncbi:MAG: 2-oxoacid:acceptor oxidoreductase family protein [Candidatus Bipolaricaulia bacterium]